MDKIKNGFNNEFNIDELYSNTARKLIEYSFDKQRGFKHRQNMDKMDYIKEFCTIRIQGPRQSGHSRAVNDLARLYDAWIVMPTLQQIKSTHPNWKKVCTPRSLDRTRGSSTRMAELNKADITKLHTMSAGLREFVLIYIG